MYICLCKAVTEQSVRDACRDGAETLEDLQTELGVATGCGQCAETACCMLASEQTPSVPNMAVLPFDSTGTLTSV